MNDQELITFAQYLDYFFTGLYLVMGLWVLSHLRLLKGRNLPWACASVILVGLLMMAFALA